MTLPIIPENLADWNITTINELIKYVGIESETFDFKREPNELDEHVCAMANTKGGFLVLGINEMKSEDKTKIIKFEKNGFESGKQDYIKNQINNAILGIEPRPDVDLQLIDEKDNLKFFVALKIHSKISQKPYFVKKTDQCFVRINTSKTRANRSIILQLFGSTVDQITNIEKLRTATLLVKEELSQTVDRFNKIGHHPDSITPPVDLGFIRNSILVTHSFLTENDLADIKKTENFYFAIHTLELLNSQIHAFNSSTSSTNKQNIIDNTIGYSATLRLNLAVVTKFLEKVITICDDFLSKYK